VSLDLVLHPLGGDDRTVGEQLTMFHLVMVVLDPYTYESAWLLETGARILSSFSGADCRTAWLLTCSREDAPAFLGSMADEFITFCDPDRRVVEGLGLVELPAFVHVTQDGTIAGRADGWDPETWRPIAANLAQMMSWSRPEIPTTGDPVPYAGTPALV